MRAGQALGRASTAVKYDQHALLSISTFRKLQKAILSAAAELGLSLRPVLESLVEWGAHHAKELDEAHRPLPCDAVVRNRTA